MKNIYFTLLLCSVCTLNLKAQSDPYQKSISDSSIDRSLLFGIPNNIALKQSFQPSEDNSDPAEISFTIPDSGKVQVLINAALSYRFNKDNAAAGFYAFAEYHWNTAAEDRQQSIQLGLGFDRFIKFLWVDTTLPRLYVTASADYNKNFIDGINSLQAVADVTFVHFKWGKFHPNHKNKFGDFLLLQYTPTIGLEEDYRFKAETDSQEGNITRATAKLSVNLFPFAGQLDSRLELFGKGELKYNIINSSNEDTGPFYHLIKAGVGIVLLRLKSAPNSNHSSVLRFVKFSITYNAGSDPLKGLKKQNFVVAALNIKI